MVQAAWTQNTLRLSWGDRVRQACSAESTCPIRKYPESRQTHLHESPARRCRGPSRYSCPFDRFWKLPQPLGWQSFRCSDSPQRESFILKSFQRDVELVCEDFFLVEQLAHFRVFVNSLRDYHVAA